MTIIKTEDGPFLEIHNVDREGTIKYGFVETLFGRIWDEYIRGRIEDEFAGGLLEEMSLKPTEVFHMMERMQMGKAEYERSDYNEMAYI